jgi:hypothetical protein
MSISKADFLPREYLYVKSVAKVAQVAVGRVLVVDVKEVKSRLQQRRNDAAIAPQRLQQRRNDAKTRRNSRNQKEAVSTPPDMGAIARGGGHAATEVALPHEYLRNQTQTDNNEGREYLRSLRLRVRARAEVLSVQDPERGGRRGGGHAAWRWSKRGEGPGSRARRASDNSVLVETKVLVSPEEEAGVRNAVTLTKLNGALFDEGMPACTDLSEPISVPVSIAPKVKHPIVLHVLVLALGAIGLRP